VKKKNYQNLFLQKFSRKKEKLHMRKNIIFLVYQFLEN